MENISLCCYGCGRPGLFKNTRGDYRCAEYNGSCPALKERKRQTSLKKYGVSNPFKAKEIKEQIRTTNLEKYGTVDPGNLPEFRTKARNTMMQNYGVEHTFQNGVLRDRIKLTWVDKYGADNPQRILKIKNKTKQTCMEKYGSEYVICSKLVREKANATIQSRYGVSNPTQNPEILERAHRRRSKKYTFPSGKTVQVMGYEPKVLDDLLKSGIPESEIITEKGLVPRIKYHFDGKTRYYFPDIYLPRFNMIIEVKSLYTWKIEKEKNMAKIKACVAAGFNTRVAVRCEK